MDHILQATSRTEQGKAISKFRRAGKVPGNIFIKHGASTAIWLDAVQLKKMMQNSNEGSLLYIEVDGKSKRPTILRHVDKDVRIIGPVHASFQEVSLKEKVTVEIELEFVGEAPATKSGLVIETPVSKIEITALPTELPEKIELDLSTLTTIDDHITAADVKLPQGVELTSDAHTVLVAVVEPMSAQPEETTAPAESDAVAAVEATAEKVESKE